MKTSQRNKLVVVQFAVVIFVSAFLLFQVQPLIGKYILPWFGGTSAVWTTCMLFFQIVLFAGYLYAHLLTRYCSLRMQGLVHFALLIVAAVAIPITPDVDWKPTGDEAPLPRILLLLSMSVGIPFFALSSTGPLLQRWFSRKLPSTSPYRLYALSNVGSLLALISYPFVFDPQFAATQQTMLWSLGFWVFAILCGLCVLTMSGVQGHLKEEGHRREDTESPQEPVSAPSLGTMALWFGLAMSASIVLLAVTNQVCLDVASVPFLWVFPLILYLLSFILCFDSDRWYSRFVFITTMVSSLIGMCFVLRSGAGGSVTFQTILYFSGLFFCCMVCHGELVRLKPEPKHLTLFYLVISAGGAAGGIFVGVIAPLLFSSYFELHFGLICCGFLTILVLFRDRECLLNRGRYRLAWIPICMVFLSFSSLMVQHANRAFLDAREVTRSFYGVLRVTESDTGNSEQHHLKLVHGRTLHGLQFLEGEKRLHPTTYYGFDSAVGLLFSKHRIHLPRKIGVVGLGVGTLASYGKKNDYFRFYEINADVVRLAEKHFSFLKSTPAEVDVVLGDGRLSLEQEQPQQFDILVLDAFSSDAIPTHLLTREACEIYLRHLKQNGVIAVHISNRHIDLGPVVAGLADYFQLSFLDHIAEGNKDEGTVPSQWILLSRQSESLQILELEKETEQVTFPILWTDDKSNLFEVLKNHEKLKFW